MKNKNVEQLRRLRVAQTLLRRVTDSKDKTDALAAIAEEIETRKRAVAQAAAREDEGPGARGRPWAGWRWLALLLMNTYPESYGSRDKRARAIQAELQTLMPNVVKNYRNQHGQDAQLPGGHKVPTGSRGLAQIKAFLKTFDDVRKRD